MTQAQDIPTWCATFQLKLMAALDAAWKTIETTNDPAAIRQARDKAKAVGELAAMARKVALLIPTPRGKPQLAETAAAGLHAAQGVANLQAMMMTMTPAAGPVAAPVDASADASVATQADHARRALEGLKSRPKSGRRGRLLGARGFATAPPALPEPHDQTRPPPDPARRRPRGRRRRRRLHPGGRHLAPGRRGDRDDGGDRGAAGSTGDAAAIGAEPSPPPPSLPLVGRVALAAPGSGGA